MNFSLLKSFTSKHWTIILSVIATLSIAIFLQPTLQNAHSQEKVAQEKVAQEKVAQEKEINVKRSEFSLSQPIIIGTSPLMIIETGVIKFGPPITSQTSSQRRVLNWTLLSPLNKQKTLTLREAKITLDLRTKNNNKSPHLLLQKALENSVLANITILNSQIQILRDTGTPFTLPLNKATLKLDLDDRTVSATGITALADQTTSFNLDIEYGPLSDKKAPLSDLTLTLKNPTFHTQFKGKLGRKDGLNLKGKASIKLYDLSTLQTLINDNKHNVSKNTDPKTIDKQKPTQIFLASGDLEWAGSTGALKNAKYTIGENQALGTLRLKLTNSNHSISGTLAFKDLDLTPLTLNENDSTSLILDQENQPIKQPIKQGIERAWTQLYPLIRNFDADLRISAQTAQLGSITFQEPGFSIYQQKGEVIIDLAETSIFEGKASGHIKVDTNFPKPRWHINARLYDFQTQKSFQAFKWSPLFTGQGTLKMHFTSYGDKATELYQNISGDLLFNMDKGGQIALDLRQLLVPQKQSSLEEFQSLFKKKSEITTLKSRAHFAKGDIITDYLIVETPNNKFTGTGHYDMQSSQVDWHIAAWPLQPEKINKPKPENINKTWVLPPSTEPILLTCNQFSGIWGSLLLSKYTALHLSLLKKQCPAIFQPRPLKRHDDTIVQKDNRG